MNTTSIATTITTQVCVVKATTFYDSSLNIIDNDFSPKIEQEFEVFCSAGFSRSDVGICMGNIHRNKEQDIPDLFTLCEDKGSFSIQRNLHKLSKTSPKPENLWMIVKESAQEVEYQEHILTEGDVLKLGKIKLRVRELRSFPDVSKANDFDNLTDNLEEVQAKPSMKFLQRYQINGLSDNKDLACRICLDTTQDANNPLVSPCSCQGTVNYIHLDCLKHWIKSRCRVNVSNGCTIYVWKDLNCELCHRPFPDLFAQGEDISELVDLIRPNKTYLILETLPEEKKFKKIFYVAYMSERKTDKTFTLGRKLDCQINIDDPSVSRLHSIIKYSDGKFILENRSSTYGTFVLMNDKISLQKGQNISMKIGRTNLSFTLAEKEIICPKQEVNENPITEITPFWSLNERKEVTQYEEEEKHNYTALEKDLANLSMDYICNTSFRRILPVSLDNLDQAEEENPESAVVHNNSFDDFQIKDELENLDRLSSKIKQIIEECYKTIEDSEKKTKDLNELLELTDNHHPREDVTMHQDDSLLA